MMTLVIPKGNETTKYHKISENAMKTYTFSPHHSLSAVVINYILAKSRAELYHMNKKTIYVISFHNF